MTTIYMILNDNNRPVNKYGWEAVAEAQIFYDEQKATAELVRRFCCSMPHKITAENLKDMRKFKIGVFKLENSSVTSDNILKDQTTYDAIVDSMIYRELMNEYPRAALTDFWFHLTRLGVADQVAFVTKIDPGVNTWDGRKRQKAIRENIKLLGVKANQYRMKGDYVAFMNEEDAAAAKLCINAEYFVDIREIKSRMESLLKTL